MLTPRLKNISKYAAFFRVCFWFRCLNKVQYVSFRPSLCLSCCPALTVALFFSTGTMLLPTLAFWGSNALLLLVDTTGKPSFITRYRIQVDKNNPVGSSFTLLMLFCLYLVLIFMSCIESEYLLQFHFMGIFFDPLIYLCANTFLQPAVIINEENK